MQTWREDIDELQDQVLRLLRSKPPLLITLSDARHGLKLDYKPYYGYNHNTSCNVSRQDLRRSMTEIC